MTGQEITASLLGGGAVPADRASDRPTGARRAVSSARVTLTERIWAAMIAGACLTLLVTAACLTPDPAGHGTHQQLGLPPCGWLVATGRPCPTCGMTTAFAAAAGGHWMAAVRAQPFATALVVGVAAVFWGALHVALTGSRVGRVAGRLLQPKWLWLAAGAWAASWAYQLATWVPLG